jgi:hypothetical protein
MMYNRRDLLKLTLAGAATLIWGCNEQTSSRFVRIFHLPDTFSRRYGDFTANITGVLDPGINASYQVNDSEWRIIMHAPPRIPEPFFTIELSVDDLLPGPNQVKIRCNDGGSCGETVLLDFSYDPSPVVLPRLVGWAGADLDVGGGQWEIFNDGKGWRVRPMPGFETYDRLLVLTGAFPGARRIKTDMIYRGRGSSDIKRPFGFGVLPMWGGRPDTDRKVPRRGWNFSLCWYYSKYAALGSEFSYKLGDEKPRWVSAYRNIDLQQNQRYSLEIEVWPETDMQGRHSRYVQRIRWRQQESAPWGEWLELADNAGGNLSEGEYAVALIAHRCQVDFGSVTIEPLLSGGSPPDCIR